MVTQVFGNGISRRRPVLIAVLGDFAVQGILVECAGTKRFKVLRYLEVPLETSVSRPRAKIARLMEALEDTPAKEMLVVTGDVQMLAAELPAPRTSRFRANGIEPLRQGARWEVAPFLAYPPEKALVSVLVLERSEEEDLDQDDEFMEDVPLRVPALVFAYSQSAYTNLERICRAYKKKLIGVMPGESFVFAAESDMETGHASMLLDCRLHEVLGALVKNGRPAGVVREPIERRTTGTRTPSSA